MNIPEYLYPRLHRHATTTVTDKLTSNLNSFLSWLQITLEPFRDLLMSANPVDQIAAVIGCLFAFYVSYKILNYVRQMVMFWLSWGFTILLWGAVGLGAWYVYVVGWEKALQDAGYAWTWGVWFVERFVEAMMTKDDGDRQRRGQPKAPTRNKYGNARGYGGGGGGRGGRWN